MAKDWYPVIDDGRCDKGCTLCLKFCPRHVFLVDDGRVKVHDPDSCLSGCNACEKICPNKAITFINGLQIIIDGKRIGLVGLEEAIRESEGDPDKAMELIEDKNYLPGELKAKIAVRIRKIIGSSHCQQS